MTFRLLSWASIAIVLFSLISFNHRTLVKGDANFIDVRTYLDKDRSGKKGDAKDKYFHESTHVSVPGILSKLADSKPVDSTHITMAGMCENALDIVPSLRRSRFAGRQLGKDERLPHLTALMQSYLSTMADIGVETWIMHGTLLGWWWNQKILPWDSDIDVQVSETTIAYLAKYYNMTEYHFSLPNIKTGRNYLLEINPHYAISGIEDKLNVIDARWIDTETGLFIDISTVRKNYTAIAQGTTGALMCKDRHHYLERDLFPLRESLFEGIQVKIPFDYAWLLEEEYGKQALTLQTFQHHKWNDTSKSWEPIPSLYGIGSRRRPRLRPPLRDRSDRIAEFDPDLVD